MLTVIQLSQLKRDCLRTVPPTIVRGRKRIEKAAASAGGQMTTIKTQTGEI